MLHMNAGQGSSALMRSSEDGLLWNRTGRKKHAKPHNPPATEERVYHNFHSRAEGSFIYSSL